MWRTAYLTSAHSLEIHNGPSESVSSWKIKSRLMVHVPTLPNKTLRTQIEVFQSWRKETFNSSTLKIYVPPSGQLDHRPYVAKGHNCSLEYRGKMLACSSIPGQLTQPIVSRL